MSLKIQKGPLVNVIQSVLSKNKAQQVLNRYYLRSLNVHYKSS